LVSDAGLASTEATTAAKIAMAAVNFMANEWIGGGIRLTTRKVSEGGGELHGE